MANFTFLQKSPILSPVLLNKVVKSTKALIIVALVFLFVVFSLFIFAIIKASLDAQIMADNDLKRDSKIFMDFYQCIYDADGIEYEGKIYISGDAVAQCMKSLQENKPKFIEYK